MSVTLNVAGSAVISNNLTVNSNALFVNSANNRVGIGTLVPSATFDVSGDVRTRELNVNGNILLGTSGSARATLTYGATTNRTYNFPTGSTAGSTTDIVITDGSQTINGAKTFTTNIIGNLTGTSTTSSNVDITNIQDLNGNYSPVFTNGLTGSRPLSTDSNLVYNPATNTLSTSIFSGEGFRGDIADTALLPSFTWGGDISTGIYRPAANTVGLTTNGIERMRINTSNTILSTDFDISKNSGIQIIYRSAPPSGGNGSITANYLNQFGAGVFRDIEDTINETGHYLNFKQPAGTLTNSKGNNTRYFEYYNGFGNALNGFVRCQVNARTKLWLRENSEVVIGGQDDASSDWDSSVLRATNMIFGTDLVGRNLNIQSGMGRGTGGSGAIYLNTGSPGVTGTTLNTATTRVIIDNVGNLFETQNEPTAISTATTLTIPQLRNRIIQVTATVNTTLPTGTTMEGLTSFSNMGYDWSVINTSAGSVSVVANTGHTIVGSTTINANASASFRSRKTALNTWVTYRLS